MKLCLTDVVGCSSTVSENQEEFVSESESEMCHKSLFVFSAEASAHRWSSSADSCCAPVCFSRGSHEGSVSSSSWAGQRSHPSYKGAPPGHLSTFLGEFMTVGFFFFFCSQSLLYMYRLKTCLRSWTWNPPRPPWTSTERCLACPSLLTQHVPGARSQSKEP